MHSHGHVFVVISSNFPNSFLSLFLEVAAFRKDENIHVDLHNDSSSNDFLEFTERSFLARCYVVLHYDLEKVSLLRLRVTQKKTCNCYFVFFIFLLPSTVFGWTGKRFLSVFDLSLPRTRVTSIGPVSLYTRQIFCY